MPWASNKVVTFWVIVEQVRKLRIDFRHVISRLHAVSLFAAFVCSVVGPRRMRRHTLHEEKIRTRARSSGNSIGNDLAHSCFQSVACLGKIVQAAHCDFQQALPEIASAVPGSQ